MTGNIKVFSQDNREYWKEYLNKLTPEQQDIYYTPEYYQISENRGDGVSKCFVFENKNGIALYPFLKNKINNLGYNLDKEYYDIQGAYGYNGVVANYKDFSFIEEFSNAFQDWCNQNQIIAEFVRFNPLLNNHLISKWINPIDLLDNIFIPLTTHEEVWQKSFHKKVREATRKAQRYGLTYKSFIGRDISNQFLVAFLEIYNHMLKKNGADASYYYSLDYFQQMINILPYNTLFTFALFDDTPISTELILHNDVNAYAFLGGTLSDYIDKSPNTFLRNEILKELIDKGLKSYNMGGGISRNDSLYLYKRSFSINCNSTFYIGKRIHNEEVYKEVVKQWELKTDESKIQKYQNFLLKYRY